LFGVGFCKLLLCGGVFGAEVGAVEVELGVGRVGGVFEEGLDLVEEGVALGVGGCLELLFLDKQDLL
jgi:hypothetical protein